MQTIPASDIASVQPQVISAGGAGLALNAMILTNGARVPAGTAMQFPNAAAVAAYFGATSAEAIAATDYFTGFTNSNVKPGAVWFTQYNQANVPAWLRGGSVSSLTLAQLQAFSGTLAMTVNGTLYTSGAINLAAATSFSNAATIMQTAFPTFPGTIAYDSVAGAFTFTTTTTGSGATITVATTGTLATNLALTTATGAVTSQGAAAASPAAFMGALLNQTMNWATFMTTFDPDNGAGNALKYAFAAWCGAQNNRFGYICWDTDITPTQSTNASTSLGQLIKAASLPGTVLIYAPDYNLAAYYCGAVASIDFNEKNGRSTMAFKNCAGALPSVNSLLASQNLKANGYDFYGVYSTAANQFQFFRNGTVSGSFAYADSYFNQIWLNAAFQLALVELLAQVKAVPYNSAGYALIRAALQDPIAAGLNFGAFVPGVNLSAAQIAEVNYAAGLAIDQTLSNQGYYLQILPAAPNVRAARGTPPINFWYLDGGSVQQITMASIMVQ